jgi:hypothetical protein
VKNLVFTAAVLARALGCSKQNVHQQLATVAPDGEQFARGNLAKAWRMDSLPTKIITSLASKAATKGYTTLAAFMLNEPFKRYEPEIPFAHIAPAAREKAFKLQQALRPFVRSCDGDNVKTAELVQRGVTEYRRVFGYSITAKHWRDLLDRTIERDNGNEEWDRPEVYLDDNPARISSTRPIAIARDRGLEVLEAALIELCKTEVLTVEQKVHLWTRACDELQLQIQNGAHEKKTKRAIIKALAASGLLGADKETIRRNLNRQWLRYMANGGKPLTDRRTVRQKKHKISQHDFEVIAGHTAARGGDLTAGWNAARASGDLSNDTDGRYATNGKHVPNRIRQLSPTINSILPLVKGERVFRADGPSIIGDYSKLFAGEIFEMDDWTPEHLCWDTNEDGSPGFRFLQGQLILVIDVASRRVLEASFTEGAYSARMIRSTLNRACENYCLCDLLNIESGLWKRARLIVGRKLGSREVIGHDEWEMGVREFMQVKNARRPQGKANIENLFHALGKIMRPVVGWCGKDMRHTMPEALKRQISQAHAGEIHPSEFCPSKEQMFEALINALSEYNSLAQNNGRLQGSSPNDAWQDKQSPTGRPSLGPKAAYLLAYHREPMVIRKSQIVKTIGKLKHVYHGPETARFDRRTVLVWWNPDDLGQIAISSLDRREGPFVVPLQEATAVTAHPDYKTIRSSQAKIDDTLRVRRVMFRSIQPWLAKARLRPTTVDRPTVDFGEKLNQGIEATRQASKDRNRIVRRAARRVRGLGLNINVDAKNAERATAAAELVREVYSDSTQEQDNE